MPKRRALLIGVPDYKDKSIVSFPDVVRSDIDYLGHALQSSGYHEVKIRGLDDIWEATRTRISDELERFLVSATQGDTVLVYLSGHGLHHDGRDYLIPTEAIVRDPARYDDFFVRIDFASIVERSKAETIIFFVDACRQGVKLTQKASYAVGWGKADRAKAQRQCYAIVFGCGAGEFAQYVKSETEAFSLFTRALGQALEPTNPAQTLAEVLAATDENLSSLVDQYGKNPQQLQKRVETNLDEDEAFSRIICDTSSQLKAANTTDVWTASAMAFELWNTDSVQSDPLLPVLKQTVASIVKVCRSEWEKSARSTPWDDEDLPLRVLRCLGLLAFRSEPMITLSAAECALSVVAPFVREAVIAGGVKNAMAANPFSLDISGVTEEGPRFELEKTYAAVPQFVRKAKRLDEQGKAADRDALVTWLLNKSVMRTSQVWLPSPLGSMPDQLKQAFEPLEKSDGLPVREILSLDRAVEMARCVFGDPERIERQDRPDSLNDEIYLGGAAPERRVREKLVAYLLVLAGHLAIDPRLLSDVIIDHLGLTDPLTPSMVIETIRKSRWSVFGKSLDLTAQCSHQALDLSLRDHARDAAVVLESVLTRSKAATTSFPYVQGLPTKVTADGVKPSLDGDGHPVYETPHIRFHLAQDEVRELLMGEQLYGDPALAIRELYQNALDACRYRRARLDYLEKTGQLNPALAPWQGKIEFKQGTDEEGRSYLECQDNGIGMGRRELSECFARAGRRFHDTPEFIEEQAEWRKYGIELYPNSQFGIGVFSYFMLADELLVDTCRLDRRGIPGRRMRARVSGSGTLFRVTEEQDLSVDSGTRLRLYLNRETYKQPHSGEKEISCVKALRDVLWVSEFQTTAFDGQSHFSWEPGVLNHPKLSPQEWLKTDSPDLYWITKNKPGQISKSHYSSQGAILADGIYAELEYGKVPLNFVVNLRGGHRPTLTVDRKKILAWDSSYISSQLANNWKCLVKWPRLTLSWMWLLTKESLEAAERLTVALTEDDASLTVGYVSWHISEPEYDLHRRLQHLGLAFVDRGWERKKVCVRQVGCYAADVGLFESEHYSKLRGSLGGGYFAEDQIPVRDWTAPDWLKQARVLVWDRAGVLNIPDHLSTTLQSPTESPTLFPKDALVLEKIHGDVSLIDVLQTASLTGDTVATALQRLRRLSPLGLDIPQFDITELGDMRIDSRDLELLDRKGDVLIGNLLMSAARNRESISFALDRLAPFLKAGFRLRHSIDLSNVGDLVFSPEEVEAVAADGSITMMQILRASAKRGEPVATVFDRMKRLEMLGLEFPVVDLKTVGDLKLSEADLEAISDDGIAPLELVRVSAKQGESVGTTLARLQRLKTFGIAVPDAKPDSLHDLTFSEQELVPLRYFRKVDIGTLLKIAADVAEPVVDVFKRWQRLAPLGLEVPNVDLTDVGNFVISEDDLRSLGYEGRVTVRSLLKASADLRESIGKTISRLKPLKPFGIVIDSIVLPADEEMSVTSEDVELLGYGDQITPTSLVRASVTLREDLSETFARARKLAKLGIRIPRLNANSLNGITVNESDLMIVGEGSKLSLFRILRASVEFRDTVGHVINRARELSAAGFEIPQVDGSALMNLTLLKNDLRALAAAAIMARVQRYDDETIADVISRALERNEYSSPHYYPGSDPFSLGYELEFLESFNFEVTASQIDRIARIVGESVETTSSRLKKFEPLGLRIGSRRWFSFD